MGLSGDYFCFGVLWTDSLVSTLPRLHSYSIVCTYSLIQFCVLHLLNWNNGGKAAGYQRSVSFACEKSTHTIKRILALKSTEECIFSFSWLTCKEQLKDGINLLRRMQEAKTNGSIELMHNHSSLLTAEISSWKFHNFVTPAYWGTIFPFGALFYWQFYAFYEILCATLTIFISNSSREWALVTNNTMVIPFRLDSQEIEEHCKIYAHVSQ